MYNYCLENKYEENFIIYYEISNCYKSENGEIVEGEVLVIYYGDGSIKTVPRDAFQEKCILTKMRNQVINAKKKYNEFDFEYKKVHLKKFIDFYLSSLGFISSLALINNNHYFFAFCFFLVCANYYYDWSEDISATQDYANALNDLDKHIFYLENEELLEGVSKDDKDLIHGISDKSYQTLIYDGPIDINTIDLIEAKDLKLIVDRVKQKKLNK